MRGKIRFEAIIIFCIIAFAAPVYTRAQRDVFAGIVPRAVYVDDTGAAKILLLKVTDEVTGLSAQLGGETVAIDAPKDGNYIYQNIASSPVLLGTSAEITLSDGENTMTSEADVIIISEGSTDEWTAEGHIAKQYKGSASNVVVPNFCGGQVIMAVGGSVNSEGEYVNIIGGKTDGIASVKISDGITAVMPCAFNGITSLTSLELPATLERIYRKAFFGCKNIDGTLVLPDRLINIGALAFYNCTALKGDLVIPGGVKTVDYAAFCNCKGFDGALVLKNGVEETGGLAFAAESGSMGFTALELSDSLKKIGYYSFQNCKKIKGELQLPEGLETISDGAFDHMTGLENEVLVIPSTVKVIGGDYNVAENTGYGGHVFYDMGQDALFKEFSVADGNEYFRAEDGVLYSADKKRIIGYPRGKTDTVFELPEGLVQIDELSFSRAAYLQKLILPDSYVINRDVPANILNQDANSLSAGLYVYTSVNELAVKDTNPNYTAENGLLYSKDKKTLWYIPTNKQGAADISNECVKIEKGAVFLAPKAYNHWSGVIIPPSVTEIDEYSMDYLNSRYSGLITVYNNDVYTAANGSVKAREYTAGDADMSGARNSTDTAILLKYIMQETGFAFNEEAADVSGDGKINVLDAILLEEKLA